MHNELVQTNFLFQRMHTTQTILLPSLCILLLSIAATHWLPFTLQLHFTALIHSAFNGNYMDSAYGRTNLIDKKYHFPSLLVNSDPQLHLPIGKHYILDFHDIESPKLAFLATDEGEDFIAREILRSGMTVLGARSHIFPMGGVTMVFLLSESHLSIHTWPEYAFAALDVYTCGNSTAADLLVGSMYALLNPGVAKVSYIKRGSEIIQSLQEQSFPRAEMEEAEESEEPDQIPILFDTHRPSSLVLPATVDICVNAGFDGDECFLWRNSSLLYSQRSAIQLIEVVDRQFDTRCLLLDGVTQFCDTHENDLYTHSLAEWVMHPLLHSTRDADVYVIGGGDGWIGTHLLTTYETLIRSIHIIDIDPVVSQITREFFPIVSGVDSFDDPRVRYIVGDGAMWLQNAPNSSADAIIIDCTDHTIESARTLYRKSFYSDILRVLRPGGRFSQQMNTEDDSYEPFHEEVKTFFLNIFADVVEWKVYLESYGGVTIMMGGIKADAD